MKESIKIDRLVKCINSIIRATLWKSINIRNWQSWDYTFQNWIETIEINQSFILKNRWNNTLAQTFWCIAHGIFTKKPEDILHRLDYNHMEEHSFLLSSLEEFRVKKMMTYEYPWTKDLFNFYANYFKLSKSDISQLTPHKKLVYYIRSDFYNIEIDEKDTEIIKVLKEYQKYSDEILNTESLSDMMTIVEDRFLKSYISIIKKEQENNQDNWDIEWEIQSTQQERNIINIEEESEISKEIDNVIWEWFESKDFLIATYWDLYNEIWTLIPKFTRKLNSIVKDNSISRTWWAFLTWKLNSKRLYKIATWDNKLFTRKLEKKHKDYIVWLLIDYSWSMQWPKSRLAVKSAILMAEVLNNVGIKFEIVWFNLEYVEFKKANQKYDSKVKNRLATSLNDNRGSQWNNDWFAIRKMNYSLLNNSNDNTERILIVLSDWKPAPIWEMDWKDVKIFKHKYYKDFDIISEIDKWSKYTKIIGIWINDDSVKQFYKDYIILNNIELLPETLLNKLKNNIKRW